MNLEQLTREYNQCLAQLQALKSDRILPDTTRRELVDKLRKQARRLKEAIGQHQMRMF